MSATARPIVVKVGSSSLTAEDGVVDSEVVTRLSSELAGLVAADRSVVLVTSAAVPAGLGVLGVERPNDVHELQAISAVGQIERLIEIAISECERYYPAFQFVLWGGKSADEAVAAAMFETMGEA